MTRTLTALLAGLGVGALPSAAAGAAREPVVVSVSSQRAGSDEVAKKLAGLVRAAVAREAGRALGEPTDAARHCQARLPCLREVALALGPTAVVVGVDAAKAGKSIAIHLEAAAADSDGALAVADFLVTGKAWQEQARAALTVFARNVADHLELPAAPVSAPAPEPPRAETPSRPPPPQPAPAAEALRPDPVAEREPAPPAPGVSGRRTLAWAALPLPIFAAGAGFTFLGLAVTTQASVASSVVDSGGARRSTVPLAELEAAASRGNTYYTVALACGIGAALFAVVTALLFASG